MLREYSYSCGVAPVWLSCPAALKIWIDWLTTVIYTHTTRPNPALIGIEYLI